MSDMKLKVAGVIIAGLVVSILCMGLLFFGVLEAKTVSSRDHPDWWRPMGGQNSQDSILERRSLIWNDNNIEDGEVPPAFRTGVTGRGKFYPRGCRGMLEELDIYCIRAAAGTLRIGWSPHPGLGPVWERTITPGAAWAWQGNFINQMWNYDSLFIWVIECDPDVSWAYDEVEPFDEHRDVHADGRWANEDTRPFIRAIMTGETPGDVPVSGVVNTIKIPSVGSEQENAGVAIANNVWTPLIDLYGAGTVVQVRARFNTVVVPGAGVAYEMRITIDDERAYETSNVELTQSVIATAGRSSCGEFVQTAADTILQLRIPLEFRRRIRIDVRQTSGAGCNAFCLLVNNMMQ